MKVYTLTENYYIDDILFASNQLIGVYASLEKAQNAMLELVDKNSTIEALYLEDAVKELDETTGILEGTYNEHRVKFHYTITEYVI